MTGKADDMPIENDEQAGSARREDVVGQRAQGLAAIGAPVPRMQADAHRVGAPDLRDDAIIGSRAILADVERIADCDTEQAHGYTAEAQLGADDLQPLGRGDRARRRNRARERADDGTPRWPARWRT